MLSRLRWNKVLRDVWRHKARSVLVVLAIAVGVATFGTVLTAREASMVDMYAGYWRNVPPNILLYLEPFDEDVLSIVRDMPEVADVEPRSVLNARVQAGDGWVNLELTALHDYDDSRIGVVRPESGDWPPGRREMLLERSTPVLFDVAAGDVLLVEMPSGTQKRLPVTGFVHEFNDLSSYISRWARGFVTLDTLEWLGVIPKYNRLYVTVAHDASDPAHLERVRNRAIDRLERCGYKVTDYDDYLTRPGKHWAYDFFSALMMVLSSVGALSLLLSGFLVVNTTMALLAQETRQIGVMKAVGARRSQVMGIYLSTVFMYGGLALLIAVPLSLLSGRFFADYGGNVMNYDIVSYGLVPWVVGLQVAMALGVPAVAALIPICAGTRMTVREAISDYGIGGVRIGLFDRLMVHVHGLPRPLMLSLRNTFRRKGRLALTLGALSLAGAIFIGVFSTQQSMLGLFDDIFSLFSYEVHVLFKEPVRPQRIEAVAARVPGITRVESWVAVDATQVLPDEQMGASFPIYGLPPDQETVVPKILEGRWLVPEDERALVVSSEMLRQIPGLALGDEVRVEIEERESDWEIVGVVLMTGDMAYANSPALADAAGQTGRACRAVFQIEDADNPLAQESIARALEEQYERSGLPVYAAETIHDSVFANVNQVNLVTYLLLIVAMMLAVVGGLGLAATMSLNVLERTREIGVLRAIGASNGALWGIIVVEGMLIGAFSWVLGALLSFPVGKLLSGGVGMAFMDVWIEYVFSFAGVWLWLALAVVVSAVASLLPARRAARISVREALAYE